MSVTAELADRRAASRQLLLEDEHVQRTSIELDGEGGESTLDELLAGVWERLTVRAVAPCPVCEGRLEAEYGAHVSPTRSHCRDCGAVLS